MIEDPNPLYGIPEGIMDNPFDSANSLAIPRTPVEDPAEPVIVDEPIPDRLSSLLAFLTGQAGTGKTFLARRLLREWPGTVLAATTGIAAVNLGEGTTINSLLKYFDTANLIENYQSGRLTRILANLAASGTTRIIIDEVSMMPDEQLTVLTRAAQELSGGGYIVDDDLARRLEGKGIDPISIVLTGDFCQLSPVKAKYAFESPEWEKYAAAAHKLTMIRRQIDPGFIGALNAARMGQGDPVADFFRSRLSPATDPNFDGSTILATNESVARFNQLRMDKLDAEAVTFTSTRWGKERGDWKIIPERFDLKKGALVMILANLRSPGMEGRPGRLIYANGDLGHVVEIDVTRAELYVELLRNKRVVAVDWVTRANTIPLESGRKKALTLEGYPERVVEKMEVIGEVTYLPLRVAYATTVHKSQGLSLDHVQIDLREGFFKAPAMTYVALSRARTAEGLRLVGTVDTVRGRCVVDRKVLPWL